MFPMIAAIGAVINNMQPTHQSLRETQNFGTLAMRDLGSLEVKLVKASWNCGESRPQARRKVLLVSESRESARSSLDIPTRSGQG
jgi:hypothetical protein